MTRQFAATALLLGFALSACSQQSDDAEGAAQASASASAAAVAQALRPQPGKYRVTMKITKVAIPGLPPAAAAQASKMFASTGHSSEFCLTPADANMGYEEMTKRAAQGKCSYDRFTVNGGQLDAAMTCETGQGMTTKSAVTGTVSPTGSNMTMTSDAMVAGVPGGRMQMEGQVITERLGECG